VAGSWIALCALLLGGGWLLRSADRPTSAPSAPRAWLRRAVQSVATAVVVALALRAFVLQVFVAKGDSAAPELPAGSWVVVWKLPARLGPGDFVVYEHAGRSWLGRVEAVRDTELQVRRFGRDDHVVSRGAVTGKVVAQTRGRFTAAASAGLGTLARAEREEDVAGTRAGLAVEALPMTEWIQGTWMFDAEHSSALARVADSATTEESRRVAQQALDEIKRTLAEGAEGMRWTITATEMQSHHAPEGTRSGPYEILESRGENEVVVRSVDDGTPKVMVLIREGGRLLIGTGSPPPPHPLNIEVPAYYRRVSSDEPHRNQ
jgi:hypothetical protein